MRSHGTASLRDVFQWMNRNYAQKGLFFPDSAGVRQAAETVSHANLDWFFRKYVAGTDEIPWDDFFGSVGLRLIRRSTITAEPGFWAVRNSDSPPVVSGIAPDGEAAAAGLAAGDSILEINETGYQFRLPPAIGRTAARADSSIAHTPRHEPKYDLMEDGQPRGRRV